MIEICVSGADVQKNGIAVIQEKLFLEIGKAMGATECAEEPILYKRELNNEQIKRI